MVQATRFDQFFFVFFSLQLLNGDLFKEIASFSLQIFLKQCSFCISVYPKMKMFLQTCNSFFFFSGTQG